MSINSKYKTPPKQSPTSSEFHPPVGSITVPLRTKVHSISSGQQLLGGWCTKWVPRACPLLKFYACKWFPWSKQHHGEFRYDKSDTLWTLWLRCWKGKRSHLLAVWKLAYVHRNNKWQRDMGGTLTLSADFLNFSFFIYKLDPIYGNLLLKYYRNASYIVFWQKLQKKYHCSKLQKMRTYFEFSFTFYLILSYLCLFVTLNLRYKN